MDGVFHRWKLHSRLFHTGKSFAAETLSQEKVLHRGHFQMEISFPEFSFRGDTFHIKNSFIGESLSEGKELSRDKVFHMGHLHRELFHRGKSFTGESFIEENLSWVTLPQSKVFHRWHFHRGKSSTENSCTWKFILKGLYVLHFRMKSVYKFCSGLVSEITYTVKS